MGGWGERRRGKGGHAWCGEIPHSLPPSPRQINQIGGRCVSLGMLYASGCADWQALT